MKKLILFLILSLATTVNAEVILIADFDEGLSIRLTTEKCTMKKLKGTNTAYAVYPTGDVLMGCWVVDPDVNEVALIFVNNRMVRFPVGYFYPVGQYKLVVEAEKSRRVQK